MNRNDYLRVDAKRLKAKIENLKYDRDLIVQQKKTFPYGVFNRNLLNSRLSEIDEKLIQMQRELKGCDKGIKMSTSTSSSSSKIVEAIYIEEVRMGDTFNMSGDFRNAILNIKSTLVNVKQNISTIPNVDESIKQELKELVNQLNNELQKVSSKNSAEAKAIAEATKLLIETIKKEKPNKSMVQVGAEGLMQAAKNLATVMPTVLTIATQIVTTIMEIVG